MAKIELKENFDFILSKLQKKVKEKDLAYIIEYLRCGVDEEQYLTSYFYASLLRELNSTDLDKDVQRMTIENIYCQLEKDDYQKAVIWSRFFREIYNY